MVRDLFAEWNVDGLLIGSAANRKWLSNFSGSAGWLLITGQLALLGTDSRYWEQAKDQAPAFELFEFRGSPAEALRKFVSTTSATKIGVEARHITLNQFDMLSMVPEIDWVQVKDSLESLRQIKNSKEIRQIETAAAITDSVMSQVNELVKPGMSERQLAWELERQLRENGADKLAFPIIVASGTNGARAHHEPGDRTFAVGDSIIIDMGAKLDGYCSDLTRTFYLGDQPDDRFQELYYLVQAANEAAMNKLQAGKTGKEIDTVARDVIESAGYGQAFGHSLGHGLGLEVHELPRLSQLADDDPLSADVVVTVEPGVYLPDWGGVRIEDLVRVTDTGVELLSKCPKNPIIPTD
jgi:Xaa-Pro aminopeptidase